MGTRAMYFFTQMIFKSWMNFAQLWSHWLWHAASIRQLRKSRSSHLKSTRNSSQSTPRLTNLKCNRFVGIFNWTIDEVRKFASEINPIFVQIDPKTYKLEMQLLFIDINAVKMLFHLRFLIKKVHDFRHIRKRIRGTEYVYPRMQFNCCKRHRIEKSASRRIVVSVQFRNLLNFLKASSLSCLKPRICAP